MEYDLATQWTLGFFAACAAGGGVGLVVGKLSRFEVGLGVGLLVAGAFSLAYVPRFHAAYVDFTKHPLRADGVVVAVEDRPANAAGDVTSPVAVVEYATSGGRTLRADSRAASGLKIGDAVVVVPHAGGAAIGQPEQMKGGAIAALLFGTFPFSGGLFFLANALVGARDARKGAAELRRAEKRGARASRTTYVANAVLFGGFAGPVTWTLATGAPVAYGLLLAFGGASLGLWLHVADGVRSRRHPSWTLGVAVVALNFSVWVLALWLLGAARDAFW
ncbi:MAG: hypothetical protein DCC71_11470 [Proteobacteria bacterium]|nr:MAG: hypothetical protein DCC71_11470 [Pseudomonadota bacterium]